MKANKRILSSRKWCKKMKSFGEQLYHSICRNVYELEFWKIDQPEFSFEEQSYIDKHLRLGYRVLVWTQLSNIELIHKHYDVALVVPRVPMRPLLQIQLYLQSEPSSKNRNAD